MAIDVFGLGNTLVDIQTFVDDKLLKKLKITKGIMTLIEEKQSMEVLTAIANLKAKSLPGGSCGNSISMAALMGAKTVYTGVVADDMYGRLYEKIISERGVKSMLRFTNTGLTGTAIVLTSADAERTMLTHLGVCGEFTKSDLNMELLSDSAIFHTTGYEFDTPTQKEKRFSSLPAEPSPTTGQSLPAAVERAENIFSAAPRNTAPYWPPCGKCGRKVMRLPI